jgi:hypothetical protein
VFCSNQLGNSRQMDLSSPGIDVKLKARKKECHNVIFHQSCFMVIQYLLSVFFFSQFCNATKVISIP